MHQLPPNFQLLESVRKQQEQQALQEYGRALKDLETVTSQFESLQHQLQEARSLLEFQHRAGCPPQEMSRLWTWCDSLQRRLLAAEHAAQTVRSRARLAFTRLLATRHISATLKESHNCQATPSPAASHDLLASHLPSISLRALAQTRQAPLWN